MGADFEDQAWSAILQPITPFRHKSTGIHLIAKVERAILEIDCLMLACYLQACLGGQSDMFMTLQLSPSTFRFTVSSVPVVLAILREVEIATPPIHISFLPCSPEDAKISTPESLPPPILAAPLRQPQAPAVLPKNAAPLLDIGDRMQHDVRFIRLSLNLDSAIGLAFQSALWQAKRSMVSPPRQSTPPARDTIIFFHSSAYSFCVASPAAQVAITACSPIATPFFLASIVASSFTAALPSPTQIMGANTDQPSSLETIRAPLVPPLAQVTLPDMTMKTLDAANEVRHFRPGFKFFNRVLNRYHTEIT